MGSKDKWGMALGIAFAALLILLTLWSLRII